MLMVGQLGGGRAGTGQQLNFEATNRKVSSGDVTLRMLRAVSMPPHSRNDHVFKIKKPEHKGYSVQNFGEFLQLSL